MDAVPELVASGASATELMVAPTLIAAAWNMPGTPERWKELPPTSAALLVEFRAEEEGELSEGEQAALATLAARGPIDPPRFSRDREEVAMLWHVREGMQGLLAAVRGPGVTMIIEDVCVPPARVGEAAKDLQELLGRHGFLQGVAGHASAGNLHFLLTPNFGEQEDLDRYEAFMGELVELIVDRYDGSLKAEHGTGVNMAHYVEREWGPKATELMWRVKRLADPDGVLGPGIVLTDDPGAHLRNLKSAPRIEDVANQCIECGFCEPVCPSRDLTTTPRQRIVLRREMARQREGSPVLAALLEEYGYDGIETCAADGLCSLQCPVGIDTGKLVKSLRARRHSTAAERAAREAARHWSTVERSARAALRAGRTLGDGPAAALTGIARTAVSHELVPAWGESMPDAAAPPPWTAREGAAAVYFPACVNRIFGNPRGSAARPSLPEALLTVSARAGRATVDPRGCVGPVLRHAMELEGLRGRPRRDGARHRRSGARLDRGRTAAARRRRELLHARAALGDPRAARRRAARALRPGRDRRLDLVGPRRAARRAAAGGEARHGRGTPAVRSQPPRARRSADRRRRGAGRPRPGARRAELLRHRRRPRPAAPRAARGLGALREDRTRR